MHEGQAQSTFLDRCGIWLSSLCAAHCLLLPVLIPLLPIVAGSIFAQVWFERIILVLSLSFGAIAMTIGLLRHHGNAGPLLLLGAGGVIYWFKDIFGHEGEPFTVFVGAMLIVSGHIWNIRLMKNCQCCKPRSHEQIANNQAVSFGK